jgi:hypothetical protein
MPWSAGDDDDDDELDSVVRCIVALVANNHGMKLAC